MGKRGAVKASPGVTPLKRGKPGSLASPSIDTSPLAEAELAQKPWYPIVTSVLTSLKEKTASPLDWLNGKISELGVQGWAKLLDDAFPPAPHVAYLPSGDVAAGPTNLRLWQLAIHPDAGNSGMIELDDAEQLCELIAAFGFKTDPNMFSGIDMLASKAPEPQFAEAFNMIEPMESQADLASIFSVFHTKGWKRTVMGLFVATVLATADPSFLDQMKSGSPLIFDTFRTVKALWSVFSSPDESIQASRAITMTSTMRKPHHCFNYLHQLKKLNAIGKLATDDLSDWNRRQGVMKAFGVGLSEATAAINLAMKMPSGLVEGFKNLFSEYGRKGPLSNEALSVECLCVGKFPPSCPSVWQHDCVMDEEVGALLAQRVRSDWKATPNSMRKSLMANTMTAKVAITSTMIKVKHTLKTLVNADVFQVEWPVLEEKFVEQYLDFDLELAWQNARTPWDLSEIAEVSVILKRHAAAGMAKVRAEHQELARRAEAANFDQLMAQLEDDKRHIVNYAEAVAATGRRLDNQVSTYKRDRYQRGCEAVNTFMSERCDIVDLVNAKGVAREISLAQRNICPGVGNVYTLFYMDLNIDHSGAALELLKPVSDILHVSPNNALLLLSPQLHANFKIATKLKVERTFEDKLMQFGVCLSSEASLHYKIDGEHAGDARPLDARFRLLVSADHVATCPWLQSKAARGNLGEAPLVRVRDMISPASCVKSPVARRLNPGERASQRGIPSMMHVFDAYLSGLGLNGNDKVLICQLNPGEFAEAGHACLQMLLRPGPTTSYKGIYVNKISEYSDDEVKLLNIQTGASVLERHELPLSRICAKSLLDHWWPLQVSAGPAEMLVDASTSVVSPVLSLCSWIDGVPTIVDAAKHKFSLDSDAHAKWAQACADFDTTVKNKVNSNAGGVSGVVPGSRLGGDNGVPRVGPDFTRAIVAVPSYELKSSGVELASIDSPLIATAKKSGQLSVAYSKTSGVFVFMNTVDSSTREEMTYEPGEILGFGKGDFIQTRADSIGDGLGFTITADTDEICFVEPSDAEGVPSVKTVMKLAVALYTAEVVKGIPGVQVDGHTLSPLDDMFHRYVVASCEDIWVFKADPLTGTSVANPKLQEIGAQMLIDNYPLCFDVGKVVWELRLETTPPPSLSIVKPKLWLECPITIKKGFYYRIDSGSD